MRRFTKKAVAALSAVAMLAGQLPASVQAADINNIGNPDYKLQVTKSGDDAFVYTYNVLDYGADNSGNADCTSLVQKLLNRVGNLGGGTVYMPTGTYKISGHLSIPKGVTLRGDWNKPVKGQKISGGTLLLAYEGRGGEEDATPFIEMAPESGCMDMNIWYPEQDANNITKYSPTIRLGWNNYFGNEYTNVKNITLVNSYIGVFFNRKNGGASPVVNGVYGTPLYKGVEIDCIADVGRIENIDFSPSYWSGSGLANAPAKGSSFEDYIYNNGTGIVMRRNDWSYTCYVNVEGYESGYDCNYTYENNGSTPNGHHYKFNMKNCKNGIKFDATNSVGILFDDIKLRNCENGIVLTGVTRDDVQFSKTEIAASMYAVQFDDKSTTNMVMYDSKIDKGVVYVGGGTFSAAKTAFNNKTPQIVLGRVGRAALNGDTFKNKKNILNNSLLKSELENADINTESVPEFDDNKAEFKSHLPNRLALYVLSNLDNRGNNDCTADIQNALNRAKNEGGGIVFIPSGKYKVLGTLDIPSGVELRGALDNVSTVPHGSGTILNAYSGKDNPNGESFIKLEKSSGMRGIVVDYPEQVYKTTDNYKPHDYPYTIQGRGSDIYVINVGLRAASKGLDLFTYKCDNHYVDFLAGHAFDVGVRVGKGCTNGILNNLMFNVIVYACGGESKFGSFPNSPQNGESNAPLYSYGLANLEFLIMGDCNNETLYNDFHYGSHIGTKFINEGNGGPQNVMSMGMGIDGSRQSVYFDSGLTGTYNIINTQVVSLNQSGVTTTYITGKANSGYKANIFNADYWGAPDNGIAMEQNTGTLNLYTNHFQNPGEKSFANVNGGNLNIINSAADERTNFMTSGSEKYVTIKGSIVNYSRNDANAFKNLTGNISPASETDNDSSAIKAVDRNGWVASASVNNNNAGNSLDGNINTRWDTAGVQTPGQWYMVDMKSVKQFNMIYLAMGSSTGDTPAGYNVYVSNDGYNWGNPVASGNNDSIIRLADTQNARYIRIEQTGTKGGSYWSIHEFYAFMNSQYTPVRDDTKLPEEETTEQPTERETEKPTVIETTQRPTEAPTKAPETTQEQGKCDLVVTNIALQNPVNVGEEAVFVATIKNIGSASTPSGIKHGVAVSVNNTVVSWCDTFFGPLKPGEEKVLTMNWGPNNKNSWTVNEGTFNISAQVNDTADFEEEDRSNNIYTVAMTFKQKETQAPTVVETTQEATTQKTSETTEEATTQKETEAITEKPTQNPEQIIISDGVKIVGYQMTACYQNVQGSMGFRTIYSVEPRINGQNVAKAGVIYGLVYGDNSITDKDMVYGSRSDYVQSYEATQKGIISDMAGAEEGKTYYARTMNQDDLSASAYMSKYCVRTYAVLEDGTIVYSDVKSYSVYNVSVYMYNNKLMNTYAAHNYLYDNLLKVANPNLPKVRWGWPDAIVEPDKTK